MNMHYDTASTYVSDFMCYGTLMVYESRCVIKNILPHIYPTTALLLNGPAGWRVS